MTEHDAREATAQDYWGHALPEPPVLAEPEELIEADWLLGWE